MITYIVFIILTGLCLIFYIFNQTKIFSVLGLLLLGISCTGLVGLILKVQFSYIEFFKYKLKPEYSVASILLITAFSLMIIMQFFCNTYIRYLLPKMKHK